MQVLTIANIAAGDGKYADASLLKEMLQMDRVWDFFWTN